MNYEPVWTFNRSLPLTTEALRTPVAMGQEMRAHLRVNRATYDDMCRVAGTTAPLNGAPLIGVPVVVDSQLGDGQIVAARSLGYGGADEETPDYVDPGTDPAYTVEDSDDPDYAIVRVTTPDGRNLVYQVPKGPSA